jgi:putative transcriptional regulator
MTQVQLAGALGVSQQRVSSWERGRAAPRDEIRGHIARILGVALDDLFAYPEPNGGDVAA